MTSHDILFDNLALLSDIMFDNLALLSDKFVPFQRNELRSMRVRAREKFTLLVVIQFLELISTCKQPFQVNEI